MYRKTSYQENHLSTPLTQRDGSYQALSRGEKVERGISDESLSEGSQHEAFDRKKRHAVTGDDRIQQHDQKAYHVEQYSGTSTGNACPSGKQSNSVGGAFPQGPLGPFEFSQSPEQFSIHTPTPTPGQIQTGIMAGFQQYQPMQEPYVYQQWPNQNYAYIPQQGYQMN